MFDRDERKRDHVFFNWNNDCSFFGLQEFDFSTVT